LGATKDLQKGGKKSKLRINERRDNRQNLVANGEQNEIESLTERVQVIRKKGKSLPKVFTIPEGVPIGGVSAGLCM